MITIVHGDNIATSRKYYMDLKDKTKNPLVMNGLSLTITDLAQALEGQGLFAEQKDIFIEDFFSKRKQIKQTDSLIQYIHDHQNDHNIVLWESKNLPVSQIKIFSKSISKKFDFPKVVFSFLDAIKPGNTNQMVSLFQQTLETEDAEFVFFMLVRHIRILLAISDKNTDELIDEIKRLAPWQMEKLQKQAKAFGEESLIHLYHRLYTIEVSQKTGKLASPLIQSIDFLLADL